MKPTSTRTRNRVVAHFKDGRLLKGFTHDFLPGRGTFHLNSEQPDSREVVQEVGISDLKAVFFVKSFVGDKEREPPELEESDHAALRGLPICVEFADGQVLRGVTSGYNKSKPGFFAIPADTEGNNERVYVVADACRGVKVGAAART